MSYYFSLHFSDGVTAQDALDVLQRSFPDWIDLGDGAICFFEPAHSLRGVIYYDHSEGAPQLGLNAFTTRRDAELALRMVLALAETPGIMLQPEEGDTPYSLEELRSLLSEAWLDARFREAHAMLHMLQKPERRDGIMTISGYSHPFPISLRDFGDDTEVDFDADVAVAHVMQDGMALQELARTADIHIPNLMQFDAPGGKRSLWQKLMGKKTEQGIADQFVGYALPAGVRTLTPTNSTELPLYALLGDEESGFRATPHEKIEAIARQIGAKEYGTGTFDLEIDDLSYQSAYDAAIPIN